MRVFVTGATGEIGSAIVASLVTHGHQVTGLTRREERKPLIERFGAKAVVGDMKQLGGLMELIGQHDGIVHAAVEMPKMVDPDRIALTALLEAAQRGVTSSLIYTGSLLVLGDTRPVPADEATSTEKAIALVAWRPAHEQIALRAATARLATASMRPGIVYGGVGGIISMYFVTAARDGKPMVIGEGDNVMYFVHRDALADGYRLILERRGRGVFHCFDLSVPIGELARAASRVSGTQGSVNHVPVSEARSKLGPIADALCLHMSVTSRRLEELGWAQPPASSVSDRVTRSYAAWQQGQAWAPKPHW